MSIGCKVTLVVSRRDDRRRALSRLAWPATSTRYRSRGVEVRSGVRGRWFGGRWWCEPGAVRRHGDAGGVGDGAGGFERPGRVEPGQFVGEQGSTSVSPPSGRSGRAARPAAAPCAGPARGRSRPGWPQDHRPAPAEHDDVAAVQLQQPAGLVGPAGSGIEMSSTSMSSGATTGAGRGRRRGGRTGRRPGTAGGGAVRGRRAARGARAAAPAGGPAAPAGRPGCRRPSPRSPPATSRRPVPAARTAWAACSAETDSAPGPPSPGVA